MSPILRDPDPPIFASVRRELKFDPLKPNRLSAEIDRAGQRFSKKLEALKKIARGDAVVLVTTEDPPQAFVME